MENLSQHIIFLLSRHECVILPGVGAFIVTHRDARYNESTGRWLPPTRHISFNPAVRNDDGLLAHSFGRRLHVDFEQARRELDLSISNLMAHLRAGNQFALGDLGTLRLEEASRFVFSPTRTPARREGELGLHAFTLPIASDRMDETVKPSVPKKRLFGRIRGRMMRAAAVCAAIAIGAASMLIPRAIGHDTQLASVVPVPVKATVAERITDHMDPDTVSISPATPMLPAATPTRDEQAPKNDTKKHHIVVATFSTSGEAEKFVSDRSATKTGKNLYVVPGRKVTRVVAASADDRETLLSIIRSAEFSSEYPGCWIWSEK